MNTKIMASMLALAAFGYGTTVAADERLARFQGGIGVIPVSSAPGPALVAETVSRNIVRNVQPPGQIWVINDLRADIRTDGSIRVDGRGLLLGGGNGIGTNAGASVFATLICEAAAPFTERSTNLNGVPLEPNGDFRIDDVLSSPPTECASPVLLIRSTTNNPVTGRAWFAAGIPKQ
jgi:hypothetical protein